MMRYDYIHEEAQPITKMLQAIHPNLSAAKCTVDGRWQPIYRMGPNERLLWQEESYPCLDSMTTILFSAFSFSVEDPLWYKSMADENGAPNAALLDALERVKGLIDYLKRTIGSDSERGVV